jgi:hypothetical protein
MLFVATSMSFVALQEVVAGILLMIAMSQIF